MLMTVLLWGLAVVAMLAVSIFSLITAYLFYQHRKYAHIPSPKPFSFYLGHFPALYKIGAAHLPFGAILPEWYEQCGPLFVIFIIHERMVFALDPKDVKEIVMDPKMYKPPQIYDFLGYVLGERFLGKGLLTEPNYQLWKPRRSLYDPAFSKVYLKTLLPSFNECVDQFLERLTPLADGKTQVSMKNEFAILTLDIISKVAFGSDYRTWISGIPELKGKSEGELLYLLAHSLEGTEVGYYNRFFQYLHPFKTKMYREAVKAIRTIGRECIQKRIDAIENGEQVPNDILTQIIRITKTDENIAIEDLVDDFATFYLAGQETTSNLLSFTLVMLLQHPPLLQRVCEEVVEVLGDRENVSSEDVDKLEYTLQVLHETLRLYPPAPGTVRAATKEITLSGYRIPKDTQIGVDSYTACRLPENFENPEKFDPSRFDPDRLKPDPFVYFPFARGHRSCIGQAFALIEARIILARMLQKFRFTLPADYKLEIMARTTMQPRDNVPCTVKPVNRD